MYRQVILAMVVWSFCLTTGVAKGGVKAKDPDPADGAIGVTAPLLQWTPGDTAMFHDVYLGTSPDLAAGDLVAARQPFAMYYHMQGYTPGTTYYWRVDEVEADMVTVHTGNVWSFTALPLTAYAPAPADGGEGASQVVTLSWLPGKDASEHHLYFGDSLSAVTDGAAETDQGIVAETRFTTGLLRAGTVYYWRVDETDTAGQTHVGEVWSFTTIQPVVGKIIRQWWLGIDGTAISALTDSADYPGNPTGTELVDLFEGPVDWADSYGTRLYGWLIPPETGAYTFWIAGDDSQELWLSTDEDPANAVMIANVPGWTPARDFDNAGGGTGDADAQQSDPISLVAGRKYYIEALGKEGSGGDSTSVAWQVPGGARDVIPGEFVSTFALAPLSAATPAPANGALDVIQSPTLGWFAGENAVQHDVYFGADAEAVANAETSSPEYAGQQAGATYNPGALEWGKTYYWRVDEVEADGTVRGGVVWSFTTADFINVEDFESYTDDMENGMAIFQTWIDGWENGTGSTVGYLEAVNGTFGETTIIHGGGQSMPLDYNNVNAPHYSETERTFVPAQNWTVDVVDTLTLYFRGSSRNSPDALYVAIEDSAGNVGVAVHPDPGRVAFAAWTRWEVPLSEFSAAGVNLAAVKKMYVGLGDRDNPVPAGAGMLYVDDIRAGRPGGAIATALFAEDFEGLPLGPNVDEGLAGEAVWTDVPPPGWTNDDSQVPGYDDPTTDGMTEWSGWGFANKEWWITTAGDQDRSLWTAGQGTVAIADPDEWDDAAHPSGTYNVFLTTPPIDISTIAAGSGRVKIDSSWRPYAQMTGTISVSYDGGEPIEILRLESNGVTAYVPPQNETLEIDLNNPAGAQTAVLTFALTQAGNDWWWAIDNIQVFGVR